MNGDFYKQWLEENKPANPTFQIWWYLSFWTFIFIISTILVLTHKIFLIIAVIFSLAMVCGGVKLAISRRYYNKNNKRNKNL